MKFLRTSRTDHDNTVTYTERSLWMMPIWSFVDYFRSMENLYFLALAFIQLMTHPLIGYFPSHWSPTGALSTAIPLFLCFLMKFAEDLHIFFKLKKNEQDENFRKVAKLSAQSNDHSQTLFQATASLCKDLRPGDIIHVKKDQIVPVDAVLVTVDRNMSAIPSDHALVSLSPLNGEAELVPVDPVQSVVSVAGMVNSEIITIDHHQHTLMRYEGEWSVGNSKKTLDDRNFIPSGAIMKSPEAYLWTIATGHDRKSHHVVDESRLTKKNSLDRLIGKYMYGGIVLLMLMIVVCVSFTVSGDNLLVSVMQFWMIFNGVIPFSVKIILSVIRSSQTFFLTEPGVIVQQSHLTEEVSRCKYMVTDKTGTLTRNEMLFTHLVFPNDSNHSPIIIQVHEPVMDTLARTIPMDLLTCLGVCVHTLSSGAPATPEDHSIRSRYAYLGCTLTQIEDELSISYPDDNCVNFEMESLRSLEFNLRSPVSSMIVNNSNGSTIYSKGSVPHIRTMLSDRDQRKLDQCDREFHRIDPTLRVLALCRRNISSDERDAFKSMSFRQQQQNHSRLISRPDDRAVFLGLVGIRDVIGDCVPETISKLSKNGVHVSMCTGDRVSTAVAVAREVNIIGKHQRVLSLKDVNNIDEIKRGDVLLISGDTFDHPLLSEAIEKAHSFVGNSLTPEQKEHMTSMIRSKQPVVAIGDGVNDIPMIRASSVGICVRKEHNESVNNCSDLSVGQFSDLGRLCELSMFTSHRNSDTARFTFYRCVAVAFCSLWYVITFTKRPESLFTGFVQQGFNILWCSLPTMIYPLLRYKVGTEMNDFNLWVFRGIIVSATSFFHGTNQFFSGDVFEADVVTFYLVLSLNIGFFKSSREISPLHKVFLGFLCTISVLIFMCYMYSNATLRLLTPADAILHLFASWAILS